MGGYIISPSLTFFNNCKQQDHKTGKWISCSLREVHGFFLNSAANQHSEDVRDGAYVFAYQLQMSWERPHILLR